MIRPRLLFLAALAVALQACGAYKIGVGMADVTGPLGITLMGYGLMNQEGDGIHLRQWSRAYIVDDGSNRLAFLSVDLGMMTDGVRIAVVRELEKKFDGLYNMDNVIMSATHTHSAPGGFLMHTFYDLPSFGFCNETFNALVHGMVESVSRAHSGMQEGRMYLSRGELQNANINRSPESYEANPEEERAKYRYNVDKDIVQLKFTTTKGDPLGVITWFAVHPTSMNNTNRFISADNMGYASVLFEQKMNSGKQIGKGSFVASFASSNLGDVSPNLRGPWCHQSNTKCNTHRKCPNIFEDCFALGPGEDMFESTKIIAERIFSKAWDLWEGPSVEVVGPIKSVHQYVDMSKAEAEVFDKSTGKMEKVRGCNPAMGYAAGAGTTDGPFLFFLQQATNETLWYVDALTHILVKPTEEDIACHAPKPILLATGQIDVPFEWQPRIVSTQVSLLGNLTIACVPGEFTTMSGRRMRNVIAEARGNTDPKDVIIAGLCNTYSSYIATYEEYQIQRYEAASTLYGPHTLSIHLSQYKKLVTALMQNSKLGRGPEPQGLDSSNMVSLIAPLKFDSAEGRKFGEVVKQPPKEARSGDTIRVTFVSGNPRNNLRLDDTYLTVELKKDNSWVVVATDANWETKMRWRLTSRKLRTSETDIDWTVTDLTSPGTYRIRHFGTYMTKDGQFHPYEGCTDSFQVVKRDYNFSIFNRFS